MDTKWNELLDLIRREDIVLFIGAGVSCSVGLPSGGDLADEICKQLPEDIRADILSAGDNRDLAKVSSVYINCCGEDSRNRLLNYIQNLFMGRYPSDISKTPIAALKEIPHFKTIISTNYDDSVEKCYGNECVVVACDNDVPNISSDKVTLIKIHGDFKHPSQIILTKEDYSDLYNSEMKSPIWNLVKSELASKNVLFLGYGYNDGNIDSILSFIHKNIRTPKKVFLVSKNISLYKKQELNAKNIIYFESDVDELFQYLILNLKRTVIDDFQQNKTSYETFYKFVGPYFTPVVEGRTFRYGKPVSPEFFPQLKFTSTDLNLLNPDNFDPIELTAFRDFEFTMGGITIPVGEIQQITVLPYPEKECKAALYFLDTDFEASDIPTQIFVGNDKMKIIMRMMGGNIEALITHAEGIGTISVTFIPDSGASIKAQIELLTIMCSMKAGERFRFTTEDGKSIIQQPPVASEDREYKYMKVRLDYLESLRKIEKYYGVSFPVPIEMDSESMGLAALLCRNIDGNVLTLDGDIPITALLTSKEEGSSLLEYGDNKFMWVEKDYSAVELHGQRIGLGYKTFEIIDPEYENTDAEGVDKKEIKLIARKGKYKEWYQPLSPESLLHE